MVDWVVDQREMDKERTVLRVSIDGGGGSLKVLGNIFHVDEDPEILFTKYEQPGQLLKGVNRIILLAYIEDLQESWHNLRIILELLRLNTVEYKLAADLKLINILLGISSHSGKYACYLCYGESNLVAGPKRIFKILNKMYEASHTAC